MTRVVPDRSFGNRGTLWSGMPYLYRDFYNAYEEYHYVGGTATGLHLLPTGSASLVVWGWNLSFGLTPDVTTVRLVMFPPDGSPQEHLRSDGTLTHDVSEVGRMATPLASCSTPSQDVAILIAQDPVRQNPFLPIDPIDYKACIVSLASQQVTLLVRPEWLYDSRGAAQPGNVRMAYDGADLGIVSSQDTRVRVTTLRGSATVPRDVNLAGSPGLPGLLRLEVASVRFNGGSASIAFTAYLNHPGLGATSVAAILRIFADGTRDVNFGNNGLWVSPLQLGYHGFVCAGETNGVVAGCVERRAVLFAIGPGGQGLDTSFGFNGIAEQDLGGPLSDPVTVSDNDGVYVFAQRGGDGRTSGCRFHRVVGAVDDGTVDSAWGITGIVTIRCDGAALTPVALARTGGQLFLGGTRQLQGADCDRIPVVVSLAASNGEPIVTYGAGAFALSGSVCRPALIAPDGSTVFVDRPSGPASPGLRLVNALGEEGTLVPLRSLPAGSSINSLKRLADGSLVIAGGGSEAWVAKLDPAGAFDPSFGLGGIVMPKPGGGQGTAKVLGVRPNGDIALLLETNNRQLAVMHPNGQLDLTYGVGGFVDVYAFTHPFLTAQGVDCFLDADGSVICVVSTEHNPTNLLDMINVTVGLRRVTAAGAYDPNFGLGAPSVHAPASGQIYVLIAPNAATTEEYTSFSPRGIAWLGSRLYVVGTGFAGKGYDGFSNINFPSYPLLLIMGWNSDGSVDATFAGTGRQEGGYDPDRKYWNAVGVLQDSVSSFFVYGSAGKAEAVITSVAGGPSYTSIVIRQPQPALFRVEHPGGLDSLFGGDGAAIIRIQEVLLTPVAGALLSGGRIRVACVDVLTQRGTDAPRTNVGGLAQWRPAKRKRILPKPQPKRQPKRQPKSGPTPQPKSRTKRR